MEIVINIPEDEFNAICNGTFDTDGYFKMNLSNAFRNGTPLPEGHGMLVDMSEVLVKLMQYYDENKTIGQCLDEVHTVIDAARKRGAECRL